jgi:hypothetical protein
MHVHAGTAKWGAEALDFGWWIHEYAFSLRDLSAGYLK